MIPASQHLAQALLTGPSASAQV